MKRNDRDAIDRIIDFCEAQGFIVVAISSDEQEGEQPRLRIVMKQKPEDVEN